MINLSALAQLLEETFSAWQGDKAPRLAAALAYYTAFSLAPLLIIALALAGFFLGADAARGQIFGQLRGLFGSSGAQAVQGMVLGAGKHSSGLIATIVGLVTLVLGAAGIFGALQDALNSIWEVQAPKHQNFWHMLRERFASFAMLGSICFLLLVSMVASGAIEAGGKILGDRFPAAVIGFEILNIFLSLALVTVLFALIFKVLPDRPIAWHDVWLGGAVTAVLFVVGKTLIGLYLGRSSFSSTYGAAGSVLVLLVWVYYSAQILLFGAEFTKVYARRFGTMKGLDSVKSPAATKFTETSRRMEPELKGRP